MCLCSVVLCCGVVWCCCGVVVVVFEVTSMALEELAETSVKIFVNEDYLES